MSSPRRGAGKTVRIAFELTTGERLIGECGTNEHLWDVMERIEASAGPDRKLTRQSGPNGEYLQPGLFATNHEINDLRALMTSSLRSIRMSTSGGVLFRVKFIATDFPLSELEPRVNSIRDEIALEMKMNEEDEDKNNSEAARSALIDDASRRPDMSDVHSSTQRVFTDFDQRMGLMGRSIYKLCKVVPLDEFPSVMSLLRKMVFNLTKRPKQDKYRKVKLGNAKLREKLFKYEAAVDLFLSIGFERVAGDDGADILILRGSNENDDLVAATISQIDRAKPVAREVPIPTVDRDPKVFDQESLRRHRMGTSKLASRNESSVNADSAAARLERKLLSQANSDLSRRNKMMNPSQLMGQEKRQELYGGKKRVYDLTVIQVEFPNRLVLECKFHPREKCVKLIEFVGGECLDEDLVAANVGFELILPPRQVIGPSSFTKTFQEMQMVPAVTVRFRLAQDDIVYEGMYLRAELVSRISTSDLSTIPSGMDVDGEGKEQVDEDGDSEMRGSGGRGGGAKKKKSKQAKDGFARRLLGKR